MSAHGVRNLRPCVNCKDLGFKQNMIRSTDGFRHGRCFIEENGVDALLKLPTEDVAGLTLDDIGADVMRKVLDKL